MRRFRYKKSINLGGGFRINLSKSGVGYSWGVKGYRVTRTARGTIRRTISIPGTGISFVDETGKRKRHISSGAHTQRLLPAIDDNHYDTQNITNNIATDLISKGLEDILAVARRKIQINRFSAISACLFLFLGRVNPVFMVFSLIAIMAKIYVRTVGRIKLEYSIDDDQKDKIAQRIEPMLKITESNKVWRIMQSSKVINKKYSAGASNTVERIICKTGKKAPFPFKSDISAATFKSGKETLIFLPDKLFILQKNKIGALSYSDIRMSSFTTRFIEDSYVPKDAKIVGRTWKYVNKSGGPDKRFKDNRELPVCQYGKIELKSSSGLNTVLMFSNISS